jgi:cytochrome c peroxidase
MAKAIEVFEATLLTPNARFDRFLGGEAQALSAAEKEGLQLFMDKGCAGCHNGVNVGGTSYFPFGVREVPSEEVRPPQDIGRFKVTNTAADRYVFKSPSLRNITLTPPYFHSGKVWGLLDAVTIMGTAQLGIQLNTGEAEKIGGFLQTLTGDQPQVTYPILPPNSGTTPRPVLSSTVE